ncbi:MAG: fibronectin type III domain-containing protein [Chitinophagales bacterium]|nr:fibronectin type III domain-containing protein [Chitinophagales bacterium]
MKYTLLFLSIFFWQLVLIAQTPINGDINGHIAGIINSMPGDSGNNYSSPGAMEESDWEDMVADILAQNYAQAAIDATSFGYTLYAFTDNTGMDDKLYYLLEEDSPQSKYWGTYVFNPDPCRTNLIIQSPHPKFDFNTGKQGIHVLHEIDAAAFMMSGTHRCNHSGMTLCSGMTKVCSDMDMDEDFRISDLAHSDNSIFQATTRQLLSDISGAVFVQLHGFTMLGSDPYVIMSNGTDDAPAPPDYIPSFRDNLLLEDATLTFKIPHIDIGWDRLVGFTNTQGRWVNGEANPCTNSPAGPSGQFIHMEQEKTKLRADVTGWDKVANALASTFACAVLPVEILDFEINEGSNNQIELHWQVAQEVNLSHYEVQVRLEDGTFKNIGLVSAIGEEDYQYNISLNEAGSYYFRLKMVDFDGSFEYSKSLHLNLDYSNSDKIWSVFPNPFEQEVNVHLNRNGAHYLRFYNHTGQATGTFHKIEESAQLMVPLNSGTHCWLSIFDKHFQLMETKLLIRK